MIGWTGAIFVQIIINDSQILEAHVLPKFIPMTKIHHIYFSAKTILPSLPNKHWLLYRSKINYIQCETLMRLHTAEAQLYSCFLVIFYIWSLCLFETKLRPNCKMLCACKTTGRIKYRRINKVNLFFLKWDQAQNLFWPL